MKEFGEHKTKAQEDYEKHKDHLIGKAGNYICSIPSCNKVWYPIEPDDVNRKRPSCFYKLCTSCRTKSYLKAKEYRERDRVSNALVS